MSLTELYTILNGITGFSGKVTYYAFPESAAPSLPFICYLVTGTNNFAADNTVFKVQQSVDIELYTATKDPATEALVEEALSQNGLIWEKTENYLSDERCFESIYTIQI